MRNVRGHGGTILHYHIYSLYINPSHDYQTMWVNLTYHLVILVQECDSFGQGNSDTHTNPIIGGKDNEERMLLATLKTAVTTCVRLYPSDGFTCSPVDRSTLPAGFDDFVRHCFDGHLDRR